MNGANAFNVEHKFLSTSVWFARAMEAQHAIACVKTKKAVFRERLILVRNQSNDIPVKRNDSLHIFDKKHNASEIHFIIHFIPPESELRFMRLSEFP